MKKNIFKLSKEKLISALSALFPSKCINACASDKYDAAADINAGLSENEFGGAVIKLSADKFQEAGFARGDSLNISFSNGYNLKDVPYYNGYYGKYGEVVVCSYPGYENPVITSCGKGTFWKDTGLDESDTADISLNTKEKYLDIQEALNLKYSNDRNDYDTDEAFANFRYLKGDNIKENYFYRGASPLDNHMKRAVTANGLLEKYRIKFVMDISDTDSSVKSFSKEDGFSCDYFMELYNNGLVEPLGLGVDYQSSEYKRNLSKAFIEMTKHEGPVYINCLEGKDRTGFVCALAQALAGASYREIKDDYMATYKDYYAITKENTPEQYDSILSIYFRNLMISLTGSSEDSNYSTEALTRAAENYFIEGGMSKDELENLKDYLKYGFQE